MFAEYLEQLPNEPIRCPVRQADFSAGFADTDELRGGFFLIGREHHAERRDHNVERVVAEWKIFSIRFLKLDGEAVGSSAGTATLQQGRHIVGRGDIAPAPRGGE